MLNFIAVRTYCLAAVVLLLCGCSSTIHSARPSGHGLALSPWPKLGGDISNSSYSHSKPVIKKSKWVLQTNGSIVSSPVIGTDGTIYVATNAGRIYDVDSKSGKAIWSQSAVPSKFIQWIKRQKMADISVIISSPALGANGLIYVGFADGNMYALDSFNGSNVWTFKAQGKFSRSDSPGSPTIGADGTVYFTSGDTIFAVDGTSGKKRWSRSFNGDAANAPAIGPDGTVYLATLAGLFALDPTSGSTKWEFFGFSKKNDFHSCSSPVIGTDGIIYIGDYEGNVYAVNSLTGKAKWHHKLSPVNGSQDKILTIPAIGPNGMIYFSTEGRRIIALDSKTGKEKWSDNGLFEYLVVGLDGTVYVNLIDKCSKLVAYDGRTGKLKDSFDINMGEKENSTPPFAIDKDGTIYIGTWNGNLYAIN